MKENVIKFNFFKQFVIWAVILTLVFFVIFSVLDSEVRSDSALILVILIISGITGIVASLIMTIIRKNNAESNGRGAVISLVSEDAKVSLLKKSLPKAIQDRVFFPDSYFYAGYYKDNLSGLHYMANTIFKWLEIGPNGCMVDFFDEKDYPGQNAPGFYTRIKNENGGETEVILINSSHRGNSFAVGAILAHEMMHLYLFRLNLKIDNVLENELLTDLATIRTGLSILILNGMMYSSQWWVTIIALALGRIYWSSEQLSFGYFKPKEYGKHALNYFRERGLSTEEIFSYMPPESRHFLSSSIIKKSNKPTELIKILEKKHLKSNLIKGSVAIVAVIAIYFISYYKEENKNSSNANNIYSVEASQIDLCKSQVVSVENNLTSYQKQLDEMEIKMDNYDKYGNIKSYNALVEPHNNLVYKISSSNSFYDEQIKKCNNLIDQYNQKISK